MATLPEYHSPILLPGRWLVAVIGISLLAVLALMSRAQVEIDPRNLVDRLFVVLAIAAVVARIVLRPARSRGQRIARDAIDHVGLFALICLFGALASYPVAADTSGFDDFALERADRLMRFNWIGWYDFVAAHPLLQLAESIAYQSIFVTPAILLGYFAYSGKRAEARLFIASFWFAALITLVLFTLAPAEGPLAYLWHGRIPYMPESALYQAQIIPLLRQHEVHQIAVTSLHGLVCAPSFHTVSAVLFIIAAWPIRRLRWPLLALNIAMLLATPVEGTHYLTDMIVGAAVALVASVAVRRGLLALIEELREPVGFDPLRTLLRRSRDSELIQLLAREPSSGPRATAILQEIDRRGLDG
ncbi:MAG TPA: phosphatase PAP2 family protein [Sphingomonas sp.]|uniref:phosphatase PAP2 family protein n=1 Tax=Sphingomonas sp. TaxID=28214 RepID=UPI002C948B96|nr:phosphatase PAP2 family protein [Sphingomonas sp.]HMI19357.1 phosphatase PAP2 family protein [Sphingomonas sp.]